MAQGLQIFDENGNLQIDGSRHLPKILGAKKLYGDGEIDLERYSGNNPWYYVLSHPQSKYIEQMTYIRIIGKKIVWKDIPEDEYGYILYGVY